MIQITTSETAAAGQNLLESDEVPVSNRHLC